MDKTILAVVGLPGAGKTVATEYLVGKTGWPRVYFGNVTFREIQKRKIPINEENERAVREELRQQHGMEFYATSNIPEIREKLANAPAVLIESLYSWEEYIILKREFSERFKVLAVHASPAVRAARLTNRTARPFTPEEIRSRDWSQIENLHQGGPIAVADFLVVNEGTLNDLYQSLDAVLDTVQSLP